MWNLLTWLVGLPSSSSHALFGGLIGAVLVAGGTSAVHVHTVVTKILVPAVLSPVIAGLIALAATFLVYRLTAAADARKVRRAFRVGQVLSASTVAFAHGANDAQKTMGVITLTLITAGLLAPGSGPPFWVVLSAGLAIGAGTYMGGWRIIRTLGRRISDIQTPQGFTAETTSAAVILTSTHLGIPLSTTQVCAGAIFGAGAGRRAGSVHWGVAGRMVVAWAVTLPAAAIVGAGTSFVAATGPVGVVVAAAGGVGCSLAIYAASRRNPVSARNVNDVPTPPSTRAAA
jgi:PiT family inorganic phosphate transporter